MGFLSHYDEEEKRREEKIDKPQTSEALKNTTRYMSQCFGN